MYCLGKFKESELVSYSLQRRPKCSVSQLTMAPKSAIPDSFSTFSLARICHSWPPLASWELHLPFVVASIPITDPRGAAAQSRRPYR